MSGRDIRNDSIDHTARSGGYGSLSEAFTSAFYGFNHGLIGNPVPYNTENHGLTFFVKPNLNLSYNNLAMVREMMPLAVDDPYSIQAAIRAYLDPVGHATRSSQQGKNPSALVDSRSAFIPLMSNMLLSLNGWPDKTVGSYTSKPGIYRESWSMVDDVSQNYGDYELSANFRNIKGDPLTMMLARWVDYASYVYTGRMSPYPDSVVENSLDYVTRIYRITLDETKQYVQKIMACGYAFPLAAPTGASGNFTTDTPFNMDTAQQVSFSFKCQGFIWNDPLLIYAFNRTVATFNTAMRADNLRSSASQMVVLSPAERDMLRGYDTYPRIEPRTNEMKWYTPRRIHDQVMRGQLPERIPVPGLGLTQIPRE